MRDAMTFVLAGRRILALGLLAAHALGGCALPGLRSATPPPAVLHPEVSRVSGEAWLQPRHNRERGPLTGPVLLEPGDWIETGATGKVEVRLPHATVRLYRHSRVQVPFTFEGRTAAAHEVQVEAGEVLVDVAGGGFLVRTSALEVEVPEKAVVLVGARGGLHEAACYRGEAEARNVRVRGQTVVRMEQAHQLTLDDGATLAFLRTAKLPDEWRRWERPTATSSGLVPPPAPSPSPAPQAASHPPVASPSPAPQAASLPPAPAEAPAPAAPPAEGAAPATEAPAQ